NMRVRARNLIFIIGLIVFAFLVWFFASGKYTQYFFRPTNSDLPSGTSESRAGESIITIASNLSIPWAIAELPDGDLLLTERTGTLKRSGENRQEFEIEGVEHAGEGGLLGLALHPDFEKNKYLYLYLTTRNGEALANRVERYIYNN